MSEKFHNIDFFTPKNSYKLLPFRFSRFEDRYIISNDYGEWQTIDKTHLYKLINGQLENSSKLYYELLNNNFIYHSIAPNFRLLSSKIKTKKSFINDFSRLHIFVLTIRCNSSCLYCQVSRKSEKCDSSKYDMSDEVLQKSIKLMLQTPSDSITMELQGGESSLNMPLVRRAILLAKESNIHIKKNINYVLCTNFCNINKDDFEFFKEHNVSISTSIDGPEDLHNKNRVSSKYDSFKTTVSNINIARDNYKISDISALMTTTKYSLPYYKEIIDTYINLGFHSIFIRELNPYGFAEKAKSKIGYSVDYFIDFYQKSLAYILDINKRGIVFVENYAALLLKKILTPYPISFVDLQSPTGTGFGVSVYNYDGYVYPSDESRMIAESGDYTFRMGNVLTDSYEEIFFSETMQLISIAGNNDTLPGCSDCAFAPFCGADPVRHYQTQNDIFGFRPTDSYCKKNKSIISLLIKYLTTGSSEDIKILKSWALK